MFRKREVEKKKHSEIEELQEGDKTKRRLKKEFI